MQRAFLFFLIFLWLSIMRVNCQIWQKTYGVNGSFEISRSIVNSYDNGFLLGIDRNDRTIWLIKGDVNGNILWSKTFNETQNNVTTLFSISQDKTGITYLTGGTNSDVVNTFIIKINECGLLEWCKRINQYDDNFAYSCKIAPNGNIRLLIQGASLDFLIDRFQIWEIDPLGNIIWKKQVLPGTKYYYQDTQFSQMCLTSDGGSLMAGYTYYPYDTINKPYDAVLQPCLVKCDSQGEMQWVYPPLSGADTTKLGFFTSCTQIGNTYYAAGSHYQLGTQFFLRPLVARFDLNGNLLSYISSEPDTMYHELSQVVSATDTSILLVSAANTVFTNPNYLMVFIADTMGNFKKSFTRTDLIVGQFGDEVAKIRDNKFIIPCQSPLGWPGPLTDVVAIKLDVRLEYDSAYTQQFTYDSLCPYPILSDTSLCNFDPFVELNKPLPAPESLKLNITPNPASGLFEVRGWARDGNMLPANSKLLVFDILGRLVNETPIPSGKQHITIGCDTWPPGIYLIRYMDEKGRTLQASLIVF